jgi:UDP-N-acetylmuramoyl-tripeptide--D-alanyl-D-alanine ligase
VTFGVFEKADVTTRELNGIKLPLPGEHNIYNALAAVAVARLLRIDRARIKQGLESVRPAPHRMNVILRPDQTKIIDDCYNASPRSMTAALRVLAGMPGRKVAVLGDMLELGRSSRAAHRRIFGLAKRLGIDQIVTCGENWPAAARPEKNSPALIKKLRKIVKPHDIILVKGSRGMKLERVVAALS